MTKIFLVVACLILPFSVNAQKTPSSKTGIEEGAELRLIKHLGRYVLLSEAKFRQELTDETYSQVLLGSYYRITKRWRVGIFGQAEQGLRWDSDWEKQATKWDWSSSQGRWDYSSVMDSTYTDLLTSRLLYEIKTRVIYYHSRGALQLRFRTGLRYFIIEEGRPIWQLFSAIEAYAPINYGEGPLYEFWFYNGAFYQVNARFALGPLLSFRQRWFRSYDDFQQRTGEKFEKTFTSTNVGLAAVYSW